MSILSKMGLFINKKKVADVTPASNVEIKPKSVNINNTGYINQGTFNGNVNFGRNGINNSPNSQVINSFGETNIVHGNNNVFDIGNMTIHSETGTKIIIDGIEFDVADFTTSETITIEIYGDVNKIECKNGNINATVSGDVGKIATNAGNISLKGNVVGNVFNQAGNINIEGDVTGKAKTKTGKFSF